MPFIQVSAFNSDIDMDNYPLGPFTSGWYLLQRGNNVCGSLINLEILGMKIRPLIWACVKIELFEITDIDNRHLLLKMCHIPTCSQCLLEELQHYTNELGYENAIHASVATE